MDSPTRAIEDIAVGFRYRKDLGDLRTLAQSIGDVGLLHPIVVTPEGRLVAGQRRLEACRTRSRATRTAIRSLSGSRRRSAVVLRNRRFSAISHDVD
jgi:hypothetical protein